MLRARVPGGYNRRTVRRIAVGHRLQTYETEAILVTFDPNVCIHSAVCLRALPDVFDVSRPRWIRLEQSAAADVAYAVRQCPSGALQYRFKDPGAEVHD
ncbi:MAG: (4Fe-4S)-binding protein [Vicinamibacterales bacterium]|nr:(4Fe-4S)-binding protein [Vicinamibacterales bacterium]